MQEIFLVQPAHKLHCRCYLAERFMRLAYIIFAFTRHTQYGSDSGGSGLLIFDNVALSVVILRFKAYIFSCVWVIDTSKIAWVAASHINDAIITRSTVRPTLKSDP